jgi:hypothetical protein
LKMTYEGAMAAAVRIADINTPVITNGWKRFILKGSQD